MTLELIVTILAVYGISALLVNYDGYKDSILKLRQKYPNSALQCVVCTCCYFAIPFSAIFLLGWGLYLTPLAVVGVVILLEKIR